MRKRIKIKYRLMKSKTSRQKPFHRLYIHCPSDSPKSNMSCLNLSLSRMKPIVQSRLPNTQLRGDHGLNRSFSISFLRQREIIPSRLTFNKVFIQIFIELLIHSFLRIKGITGMNRVFQRRHRKTRWNFGFLFKEK